LEIFVLGSGVGGKLIAWHVAQWGRRTAVVEKRWVGGSCPNIACMPSKNEIASAKVARLARDGGSYGTVIGFVTVDMATVRRRMERALISRRTKDAEQRIARRLDCPHSRHFPMKALTGRVNPKVLCARALA
jgi:pyruvate/2-oxoglutarate dehydrogenase complex dihydrolipoamide dehydrogenase (E3) component